MYDITACIVLFNNDRSMLLKAIMSFLNTNLSVKLYLIDNSPEDQLKNIICDQRVSYIFNPANPGFGAAHNIVIKKILGSSKYHLVLNPDIYFDILKECQIIELANAIMETTVLFYLFMDLEN